VNKHRGKHIPNRPTYHNVVFVLLVVPPTKAGDISASGQCAENKKKRKKKKTPHRSMRIK
jgi:hypothetical protein